MKTAQETKREAGCASLRYQGRGAPSTDSTYALPFRRSRSTISFHTVCLQQLQEAVYLFQIDRNVTSCCTFVSSYRRKLEQATVDCSP